MTLRMAALLMAASGFACAGTWTGRLVDAGCFTSEVSNVTKDYGPAERDMRLVLDACAPGVKTKAFALVLSDGSALQFDNTGNAKAAELVKSSGGKRHQVRVAVDGDADGSSIRVSSIANESSAAR